ncbi:MAG: hypothetical protein VX777_00360 [Chlamydiota bacterium]|nr:hypothetical protein [Chlamydiota bacterium]
MDSKIFLINYFSKNWNIHSKFQKIYFKTQQNKRLFLNQKINHLFNYFIQKNFLANKVIKNHLYSSSKPIISPTLTKTSEPSIHSNHQVTPIDVTEETRHIEAPNGWKIYPDTTAKPREFDYVKPKVDLSFLGSEDSNLKEKVEKRCLEKMRASMKALDPSLVDGIKGLMKEGSLPRAEKTLNNFCNRVMDTYEAYVEVQMEENTPEIPLEIGFIKASGFTHDEILDLEEPCKWYDDLANKYKSDLVAAGVHEKDTQHLVEYVASKSYKWSNPKSNEDNTNELEKNIYSLLHKNNSEAKFSGTIESLSKQFSQVLNTNKDNLKIIKDFDRRIAFAKPLMKQSEKEEMKTLIADTNFKQFSTAFSKDAKHRLIQELRQRFEWQEGEPGYIGSPLKLLNTVRGDHDAESTDSNFRAKLFFIYGSKNMINEVARSESLVQKINTKLSEKGKGWQLDEELTKVQREKSAKDPIYRLGTYAKENHIKSAGSQGTINNLRRRPTLQEAEEAKLKDENKTFADYERIAKGENVLKDDHMHRFRFPLYPAEEMLFFGTESQFDSREMKSRETLLSEFGERDLEKNGKADTHFGESYLDYKKRTTQNPWNTGKHLWKTTTKNECGSPYLDAVEDLGLPTLTSISGSTDQTLTMAGAVGVNSIEELSDLRGLYIPWMTAHQDHTAHEIMTAAKSFNVPYTPSPDYYKQIFPQLNEQLIPKLEESQRKKGFELPDYYLSSEYAKTVAAEERNKQNENVQKLMKSNQLMLHGARSYRTSYSLEDPFGDNKFKRSTNFLTDINISKVNKERKKKDNSTENKYKYDLDYNEKIFKPHQRSKLYKGSKKRSLSLVPPTGKIIPYVPHDQPSLNRVGLLFDRNECQVKEDKFVYEYDAHVDTNSFWKKEYTERQVNSSEFNNRLKNDAKKAIAFSKNKAHHITMDNLIKKNKKNADVFMPFNEINGSIHNKGIVGVYTFSRGLPTYTNRIKQFDEVNDQMDWGPLEHETVAEHRKNKDYDLYMRLMGVGKRLAVIDKFGKDVPLYEINETTNTGMALISHEQQIEMIKEVLENKNNELTRIAKMVKHQSETLKDLKKIKKSIQMTLKVYLKKLQPQT